MDHYIHSTEPNKYNTDIIFVYIMKSFVLYYNCFVYEQGKTLAANYNLYEFKNK